MIPLPHNFKMIFDSAKKIGHILIYVVFFIVCFWLYLSLQRLSQLTSENTYLKANTQALLEDFDSVNTTLVTLKGEQLKGVSVIAKEKNIKPKNIVSVYTLKGESKIDTVIRYDTIYTAIDTLRRVSVKDGCFVGEILLGDSASVSLVYSADFEVLCYKKRPKKWFGEAVADFFTFRWNKFGKYWEYRVEVKNKCDKNFCVDENVLMTREK